MATGNGSQFTLAEMPDHKQEVVLELLFSSANIRVLQTRSDAGNVAARVNLPGTRWFHCRICLSRELYRGVGGLACYVISSFVCFVRFPTYCLTYFCFHSRSVHVKR